MNMTMELPPIKSIQIQLIKDALNFSPTYDDIVLFTIIPSKIERKMASWKYMDKINELKMKISESDRETIELLHKFALSMTSMYAMYTYKYMTSELLQKISVNFMFPYMLTMAILTDTKSDNLAYYLYRSIITNTKKYVQLNVNPMDYYGVYIPEWGVVQAYDFYMSNYNRNFIQNFSLLPFHDLKDLIAYYFVKETGLKSIYTKLQVLPSNSTTKLINRFLAFSEFYKYISPLYHPPLKTDNNFMIQYIANISTNEYASLTNYRKYDDPLYYLSLLFNTIIEDEYYNRNLLRTNPSNATMIDIIYNAITLKDLKFGNPLYVLFLYTLHNHETVYTPLIEFYDVVFHHNLSSEYNRLNGMFFSFSTGIGNTKSMSDTPLNLQQKVNMSKREVVYRFLMALQQTISKIKNKKVINP